jgi:hypothetical protein
MKTDDEDDIPTTEIDKGNNEESEEKIEEVKKSLEVQEEVFNNGISPLERLL